MAKKIKVILKEVNKPGVLTEINNDYKSLQKIAGGIYETIDMSSFPVGENIDMIFADDYLFDGSKANFLMPEIDHIMCGTCIIAGFDPDTGETISLSDEQIEIANDYLERNQVQNMDKEMAYYTMKAFNYKSQMEVE